MNTDPQKHSNAAHHSYAVGTVSFKMVREFARELAQANGRSPYNTFESDWAQAKRELSGQPDLEAAPTRAPSRQVEEREKTRLSGGF